MGGAPAKRPSAELSLRVYERPLYQLKGRQWTAGPSGEGGMYMLVYNVAAIRTACS